MKTQTCTLAVIMLLATAGVSAQGVYKSTMPDGKVVYSEKPAPGATRVDKLEPPPAKTGVTSVTPEEKARADKQSKERAANASAAAQNEVRGDELRKQVQQAEAARAAGKEPLPNERQGTVGGGSRLTEAYFTRQKSLEDAVAAARKRAADSSR